MIVAGVILRVSISCTVSVSPEAVVVGDGSPWRILMGWILQDLVSGRVIVVITIVTFITTIAMQQPVAVAATTKTTTAIIKVVIMTPFSDNNNNC